MNIDGLLIENGRTYWSLYASISVAARSGLIDAITPTIHKNVDEEIFQNLDRFAREADICSMLLGILRRDMERSVQRLRNDKKQYVTSMAGA
jgi:hypothetical protein